LENLKKIIILHYVFFKFAILSDERIKVTYIKEKFESYILIYSLVISLTDDDDDDNDDDDDDVDEDVDDYDDDDDDDDDYGISVSFSLTQICIYSYA